MSSLVDQICSICTDIIREDFCTTQCLHPFHYRCISLWLQRSETCPDCRRAIYLADLIRNFAIQQNSLPSPTVPSTSIASYKTSTNSQRAQSNNQPRENALISNQSGLTARKLCAATLLFSNGTRDFSILHVELDQASFLIPFMPAYVSGNGLVYDSLKSIKIDCCIDVPCAYDMEAFLNVCQGLAPSMGNLTWIIPESPKLGYDRFCKVLRNLQEAPQIQRIVEKVNVNGVGLVKAIVFIGNVAYEILKATHYPLCYIISGPTVKICYLIDDNRITMNIQDLDALAEAYKFDYVFMKVDLRREAADEIFKVHEILRPKKTIYIIPYAFKYEMDVYKIYERLESRCRFEPEISINCFELLSCGKSYSNRLILNEPDTGTTSTRRSRPRGFYNLPRGYMHHPCMENRSDEPRNQADEDETNVIGRHEAGWLLGMTGGSAGFI